jgi:hypothetical protein
MNVSPSPFSPSCSVSHEVVGSQSDSDGGGSSLIDKLTAVPAWKVRRTENREIKPTGEARIVNPNHLIGPHDRLPTVAVEPGKCEGRAIVRYVRHKKSHGSFLSGLAQGGVRTCEKFRLALLRQI